MTWTPARRLLALPLLALLAGASWPTETVPPADAPPWSSSALGVERQDLVVGTGDEVVEGARVTVHYVGMLGDGTVFDESRPRGTAFDFRVGAGQVIRGWEDGLLGMRVGGTRRLVIPSSLGYGTQGAGSIPGGATLYFEVELLSLKPPRKAPQAPPEIANEAWTEVKGVTVADVKVGTGARIKTKEGARACLDLAKFDALGKLVEQTYSRERCTWYVLGWDDVPAGVEPGLKGLRESGVRAVRDGEFLWLVELTMVGI
ncbi:MAG: FKBP-type peptidyl-prolyl cis-trans isomerase [Myxococcota bacterium]